MKNLFIGLLAAGILAGMASQPAHASARRDSSPSAAPRNSLTITDSAGRLLSIRQPIERVAVLDTGPFEVLAALGVLDRVVGNHKSLEGSALYPELAGIPVVATNSEINFELLAELQPQIVISSVRAHGVVTDEEILSGFDITDIKLNLRNPDLMKSEILLLGKVFGREKKAQEIVAFYDRYEKLVADKVKNIPDRERPRVFVEYHAGDFKTGAPNSRFYQQVVLAGANNITVNLIEEPQVDPEWVAEKNPDFFIREASGFGYGVESTSNAKSIYSEIKNRKSLENVNAIKNNKLYLVSVDIYSRPGYIVGVCYLAKWFYPQIFADLNPEQVHREYMELFHPKIPYKGLWTYHE
jgi:iron complex transport system substrate-binding protein